MRKKIISLLLVLAMILGMTTMAFAADSGDITILYTNDVHCGYLPYDKVAALAKDADLLVDCGDAIQGDVIGTLSKGEYVIDIMNYLGYDVATFGNHEFDYSFATLQDLVAKKAKFPYVCCNMVDLKTGKALFDAYKIIEVKGKKIAFVGITTPETFVKSTPTYFQDADGNYIYGFCEGNNGADLYAAVQKAADAAKAEGADYVIAVAHLGIDDESKPWTSKEVIANTTGIDAILDGHSHSEFTEEFKNKDGKAVVAAQTGTKLDNVGKLTISGGKFKAELVALEGVEADADATAFIATITEKFDALQKQVVAKTKVLLTTKNEDGSRAVRSKETNLGDLCADAYRELLGADVAFVNGGGVRADIAIGDITYGDIIAVHPFGNSACLVEVTGQQILDALELGSSKVPGELGGFLQVSGLTYTIDTAVKSTVELNDKSEFVKVTGARRVSDVMVGGEPIDPAKTYKLASHNYMLKSSGDGYTMFGKKNVKLIQDEVLIDNQVLINYIVEKLDGVVGNDYAQPKGRILMNPFADVPAADWYHEYVTKLYNTGIVNGMNETTFAPKGTLTWGQALKLLLVAHGDLKEEDAVGASWLNNTMAAAIKAGLVDYTTNGEAEIARVDFCTVAAKLYKIAASKNISQFSDTDDGYVKALNEKGVISGVGGGAFAPDKTLTRAEISKIIYKLSTL